MLPRDVDMKITSEFFRETGFRENIQFISYFHEATDILQGDKNPTAPKVIPTIQKIAFRASNIEIASVNAMKELMLSSLQRRFTEIIESPSLLVTSVLDPNIKLSFTEDRIIPGDSKFFVFEKATVRQKIVTYFTNACQ